MPLPPEFLIDPRMNLGSPCEAFETIVSVTLRCKCEPSNTPVVLRGVECMYGCPKCGTVYGILGVEYSRELGQRWARAEVGIYTALQGQVSGLTFEREVARS